MKPVTVVAQDRVGLMSEISYILGKSKININSLNVDVIGDKAIISMKVKDPKVTTTILEKNGFNIINSESIVVRVPPDEIDRIARQLNNENVVVEDMYVVSKDMQTGIFALNVDKPRKAVRLLNEFIIDPEEEMQV